MKRLMPALISSGVAVIFVAVACAVPATPLVSPAPPVDSMQPATGAPPSGQPERAPESAATTASVLPTAELALTPTRPGPEPAGIGTAASLSGTLPGPPVRPLSLFQSGGEIFGGDAGRHRRKP